MATETYLVVGATGQQGSSVLTALSELLAQSPKPAPKILALTRSATSAKAKDLGSKYPGLDLTVVEGDTKNPDAILTAYPSITSIFLYTTPPNEESQGLPLIAAAAAAGNSVRHIVFSSVDRGGDARSWDNPTDVAHFLQKHNIELRLRELGSGGGGGGQKKDGKAGLEYTILRPVAFFDNFNPTSPFGAMFASMWGTMPQGTKLQLVSVRDIGRFAARALVEGPEKWGGRAVGLAGEELTLDEAKGVFRKVAGRELPESWWILGKGVRWMIGDVGKMFKFFEDTGYGVDVAKLKAEDPELQDFEKWLKESSKFDLGGSK